MTIRTLLATVLICLAMIVLAQAIHALAQALQQQRLECTKIQDLHGRAFLLCQEPT